MLFLATLAIAQATEPAAAPVPAPCVAAAVVQPTRPGEALRFGDTVCTGVIPRPQLEIVVTRVESAYVPKLALDGELVEQVVESVDKKPL